MREAQAVARLGSWEWDIPSDTVTWSDELYSLYGIAPQSISLTYATFLNFVHPDDRGGVMRIVSEALEDHQPFAYDHRIVAADGVVRTLHARGQVVCDQSGRPVRMLGTGQDVTEHREVMRRLLESETRLRAIFDSEPQCVKLVDGEGCLITMNPAGLAMLEVDRLEDLAGTELLPFVVPEYRDAFAALHKRVFTGESGTLEFEVEGRRGTRRWLETHAVPLRDGAGTITALLGITRDVTKRKHAELALQESEERYRSLFEGSPLMYFTVDQTGIVRAVNDAAVQQLGYAREVLVGHSVFQVFHPADRAAAQERLAACAAGDPASAGPWEFRKLRRDGRELWVREFPRPIAAGGERLVFIICEDITERRRAQDVVLRSRAQLRDLAARLQAIREEERARIAREIHDEVGQVLTALKIDLAYLEKRLPATSPQVGKKLKDMATLVDDTVQTIHRIATELRPGILDDLGLPSAIRWLGREFAARTGISVHATVTPDELTVRPEQATAAFRILQESLTNVARHAQATEVRVTFRADRRALELVVQDDGVGISEAQVADHASLGLLGMSERAQACGGVLSVIGVPRQGTTLTLFLPLT